MPGSWAHVRAHEQLMEANTSQNQDAEIPKLRDSTCYSLIRPITKVTLQPIKHLPRASCRQTYL